MPQRPPHTALPQDQPQDKAALRRRMRMVREMVDDRLVRSVELWSAVAALPEYQTASTVMAFHGFGSEPDTDPLFARLAAEGKRLLLPRIEDNEIAVVDGSGPTVKSRIGVSEPQGPALPFDVVEFVIVPGLAFTAEGYRLGYGGGFYDRFLPQLQVPNVGVCFAEQLCDELPAEPHDVRVLRVVSA
ncbi:MAG: 5-formyltetrahydrofolate cyclo-ligase [Ilumatobacteraceae bacterium]